MPPKPISRGCARRSARSTGARSRLQIAALPGSARRWRRSRRARHRSRARSSGAVAEAVEVSVARARAAIGGLEQGVAAAADAGVRQIRGALEALTQSGAQLTATGETASARVLQLQSTT